MVERQYFDIGPIRPPNEGQDCSLLIRVTRNCAWNRCLFCRTYKGERFVYRPVEDVKEDISAARAIADELTAASWRLGRGGRMTEGAVQSVVEASRDLHRAGVLDESGFAQRFGCIVNVANWLACGARTVFLQDADSMIVRQPELVDILKHIKACLSFSEGGVERVTTYARSKTVLKRTTEQLAELREAGLARLHIGLESGADDVLRYMEKGVTGEEHIVAGRKAVAAGMTLSEYVMPGIGGVRWSGRHAIESARVLSAIDPHFIRLRSLAVRCDSPLVERVHTGDFDVPGEDEVVAEIGLFLENLDCHSYIASDQMCNLLWEIEGQLPEAKPALLEIVRRYLAMRPLERLRFCLERRVSSYVGVYGRLDETLEAAVDAASQALDAEAPDAREKVEAALMGLKQGFV